MHIVFFYIHSISRITIILEVTYIDLDDNHQEGEVARKTLPWKVWEAILEKAFLYKRPVIKGGISNARKNENVFKESAHCHHSSIM